MILISIVNKSLIKHNCYVLLFALIDIIYNLYVVTYLVLEKLSESS